MSKRLTSAPPGPHQKNRTARLTTSLALLGLAALLSVVGCGRAEGKQEKLLASSRVSSDSASRPQVANTPAPLPSSPIPSPTERLQPLGGLPWLMHVPESAKIQDVVTLPLGATEPRPLLVAVHGAGDRPEWACGGWRIGVDAHSFVVCPRGLPMSDSRYGWGNPHDIAVAVDRAVSEVQRRFQKYVIEGPLIYAGFSQGATLAGNYLIQNAQRFPVAALAEGGYNFLVDSEFARKYRSAGGRRILILCGTAPCMVTAKRAQVVCEQAGLGVFVAGDPTAGHNLNAPMQQALKHEWARLVEGIPGWESYLEHRSQ